MFAVTVSECHQWIRSDFNHRLGMPALKALHFDCTFSFHSGGGSPDLHSEERDHDGTRDVVTKLCLHAA